MAITYRGKELVDVPKNKAYIPILQYNASIDNESKDIIYGIQSKAITPDFADTDNTFGNFIYDKNKFNYLANFIKSILLSTNKYKMKDLYPDVYRTMTEIPNGEDKLWDTSNVTDMNGMFEIRENLSSLNLSHLDTSKVIYMDSMFWDCSSLVSLDVSNFDTSKVTNMSRMFCACENLTQIDLSTFNMSSIEDINQMFNGCRKISKIILPSMNKEVHYLEYFFSDCENLSSIDFSLFKPYFIISMRGMFKNCKSLTFIKMDGQNFNRGYTLQNTAEMFYSCESLKSVELNFLDKFIEDMTDMFNGCENLESINGIINMASCTKFDRMFKNCPKLTGVKIKNPPADFETKTGLTSSQYTVVQ